MMNIVNDSNHPRRGTTPHADIASLDRLSKHHNTLSGMGSPAREYGNIARKTATASKFQSASLKAALCDNKEVLALKKCT